MMRTVLLLALASIACAQVPDPKPVKIPVGSEQVKANLLQCTCSPSGRGFSAQVKTKIDIGSRQAEAEYRKEIQADPQDVQSARTKALEIRKQMFKECIDTYGAEACVNADAATRRNTPNQYCAYDKKSGRNLREDQNSNFLLSVGKCNLLKLYSSAPADLGTGNSVIGRPAGGAGDASGQISDFPEPKPNSRSETGAGPPRRPPRRAGGAAGGGATGGASTGGGSGSTSGSGNNPGASSGEGSGPDSSPPAAGVINEGCVAIEHLTGYVMQHRQHLVRRVLCNAKGFCATPNHAIIVDGVYTSMKRLCSSKWDCTRDVKLVNNLKIARNTRAVVGDIVVTPYDVRFPIASIWALQIAEDIMELSVTAIVLGALVVAGALVITSSNRTATKETPVVVKETRSVRKACSVASRPAFVSTMPQTPLVGAAC